MMDWNTYLKENLRPDQLERLDAYDVQILISIYKKREYQKRRQLQNPGFPKPIVMREAGAIWSDVHGEMGGITEEDIYERLKKLSDMALIRVYATFNREMPEGL